MSTDRTPDAAAADDRPAVDREKLEQVLKDMQVGKDACGDLCDLDMALKRFAADVRRDALATVEALMAPEAPAVEAYGQRWHTEEDIRNALSDDSSGEEISR